MYMWIPGFNDDDLLPVYKGFKCVTQFATLFQVNRAKINKIKPVECYFCILDAYVSIQWNL